MTEREMQFEKMIRLAGQPVFERETAEYWNTDVAGVTVSRRFRRRMRRMLRGQLEPVSPARQRVFRTALIAAVLMALLAVSAMAVPMLREAVVRTWITWTGRSADFRYSGRVSTDAGLLFTEPQYLPDGYSETTRLETSDLCEIIYENASGVELIFSRTLANSTLLSVDSEHSTYSVIEMGGIQVHLFTATSEDDPSHVVMYHGNTLIHIAGYVPTDELLKMLESLF